LDVTVGTAPGPIDQDDLGCGSDINNA